MHLEEPRVRSKVLGTLGFVLFGRECGLRQHKEVSPAGRNR